MTESPSANIHNLPSDDKEQHDLQKAPVLQKRDKPLKSQSWSSSMMMISTISPDGKVVKSTMNSGTGITKYSDRTSAWSTLDFNVGRVRASMISRGPAHSISIQDQEVLLNGGSVCTDVSKLGRPYFQRGTDGSYWYTNLPIGRQMNEKEIAVFKDRRQRIKAHSDKMAKLGLDVTKAVGQALIGTATQVGRSFQDGSGTQENDQWDFSGGPGDQLWSIFGDLFSGLFGNPFPQSESSFSDRSWDSSSSSSGASSPRSWSSWSGDKGSSSPRSKSDRERRRRGVESEREKRQRGKTSPQRRSKSPRRDNTRYGNGQRQAKGKRDSK